MGRDGEQRDLPMLAATASKAKDGAVHISLSNVDLKESNEVTVDLAGLELKTVTGQMLTVKDIADQEHVRAAPTWSKPVAFKGAKLSKGKLVVKMPPMSIVALELK